MEKKEEMIQNAFKFKIQYADDFIRGRLCRASIKMEAPHLCITVEPEDTQDEELKLRLMKAELKQEMIKALLNGEWVIENEN